MGAPIRIIEVGPRDGLQNEPTPIPTAIKVELIQRLAQAGLREIEAASFVSPRWVPQMADSVEVMKQIRRDSNVKYSALTPNMQGFNSAQMVHCDEVVIFGAASETFSRKNINCSISESIARFIPVVEAAHNARIPVRASISCALGCPYEGGIPTARVLDVVKQMRDLGVQMIDIADTIGVGNPKQVQAIFKAAAQEYPLAQLSAHFHDTYGQALANVYAALEVGVETFHASIAGLGGCPYAKGATGNVATEDVLYLLNGLGCQTGINFEDLSHIGEWISGLFGRQNQSRAGAAWARAHRA